jgi:hypothetical protein
MTDIFIDIPVRLKHQSQVVKFIFLMYHPTIESNTLHLLYDSTKITLYILYFRHIKSKIFCIQNSSLQLQLLVKPCPTLIHQNHIICKEYTQRGTTLYVFYNLIHHQNK